MKKEAVDKIEIFTKQWQRLFNHLKPDNITENIDLLEDHLSFEKLFQDPLEI